MIMELSRALSPAFAALGNEVRLAIVERLMREGELSAGDLAADGDVSAPAMSHHFKVLHEAGIVARRVDAQRRLYSVRPEAMQAIGEWALTYRQFWDQSLDRLGGLIHRETKAT